MPSGDDIPAGVTVLLVDDDPDMRLLMRDVVSTLSAAVDVREAGDGLEALAYLRREGRFAGAPRPDLVYLDLEMPRMGGQGVLRELKNDPDLSDIPVVVLTGLDDDEQRRIATDNGAVAYVLKPTDPRGLLRDVAGGVRRWLENRTPPAGAAPTPPAAGGICR